MSEKTNIEWTDHTWNPWIGCTKVSPGCAHCYAETLNHRWGKDNWGKGKPRRKTVDWRKPVKWNRDAPLFLQCTEGCRFQATQVMLDDFCPKCGAVQADYTRPRVFPSLCDWLDDEVPIEWLADFLRLIHDTPNLDWLLRTKRPENWRRRVINAYAWMLASKSPAWAMVGEWLGSGDAPYSGVGPSNVWIGASVEDQPRADERIPEVLKIPARVRFLSAEPLLGPVNLKLYITFRGILNDDRGYHLDWVIIGGESGPGARPCNVAWMRDIVRQCAAAGVRPFVKQLGKNPVNGLDKSPALIRHPKGGDPSEWPEDLRVREFPEVKP